MEVHERQQKAELLGKLVEHYLARKQEIPMGFNAASAAQLRSLWGRLRAGCSAVEVDK